MFLNIKKLMEEERGEINMVAILLILLVVVVLAGIFREKIIALLTELFEKLQNEAMSL